MPVSRPQSDLVFELGKWTVTTTRDFGPRITGAWRAGLPNMFARLPPSNRIELANSDPFVFRGGHRVWAAPETPSVTYANDDHHCIIANAEALAIQAPPDAAGITKELVVQADGDELIVDQKLTNAGGRPITVAVWGITQFRLGGVAILPLGPPSNDDLLQADRSLVLWPYTRLDDPRIGVTPDAVLLDAISGPRLKLGVGPAPGALGYFSDGALFRKSINSTRALAYPDRGAVGQVFVNDIFCELESVDSLASIEPGESTSSREIWSLDPCPDLVSVLGTMGLEDRA